MKQLFLSLGLVMALVVGVSSKASALTCDGYDGNGVCNSWAPDLLPGAVACVGTGSPGVNQFTIFVSTNYNTTTYCQTITIGFGPYIANDLNAFGWDGPTYSIKSLWNGPNVYVSYYTGQNQSGPWVTWFPNRKAADTSGWSISSLKGWHS
jgi:hypothetical protein